MNEEEIEEIKDLDRVIRFPNTMPNFLKGGNWTRILMTDSPWWDPYKTGIRRDIYGFHRDYWGW